MLDVRSKLQSILVTSYLIHSLKEITKFIQKYTNEPLFEISKELEKETNPPVRTPVSAGSQSL